MNTAGRFASLCAASLIVLALTGNLFSASCAPATKDTSRSVPKKMVLNTPDGRTLLLKEDNTWEPEGNRELIVDKDFTVPIKDGRFVLVNADGTWAFVTKELLYAEDMLVTDKVVATGTGRSIDINAATNAATKQALDNAVVKTREAARGIKTNPKKFRECVERVEKEVQSDENFVNGKGWTVNITVTLDKGSLLAVIGCARDTASTKP